MGGALVLPVPDQLPRPRIDDDRTWRRGGPLDHLPVGAAIRPGNGETAALAVARACVGVRGKWAYLYRALDKFGNTIDFYLWRPATPGRRSDSSARR